MKKLVLAILAAGTALAAAAPANAALVIGYSVNGGPVTQLATDAGTPGSVSFNGTAGGYTFNTGALGTPNTSTVYDLLTQSINIKSNGAAATLNVFITETNLPTIGGSLMSAFTSNILNNATATISSYYSPTNALYGGTLLQSANFSNIGTFTGMNAISQTGPFSLTTRYDIAFQAGQGGTFNGTANLTAVPEPATWGMMMLGFGAMGFALRRRRNVETRIRFA